MHFGAQHESATIDQDVAFAAIDALGPIVATDASDASRAYRLAVDNAGARMGVASDAGAELLAKGLTNADLGQALKWADLSITTQKTFANLRTKAAILEKQGDTKQAEELRAEALKIANEADMNVYGYALLGQKKTDEAIVVFRKNVKDHPDSWNTYDSLGEALAAKGDKKAAMESYNKALSMTSDPVQKKRINEILTKLKA